MASAALDRLLHRATVINIRGESCRLRSRQRAGSERIDLTPGEPQGATLTQGQSKRPRARPAAAPEHEEVSA
jgi:hypothetical protein